MMKCENDKFLIPEKYKRMSISELVCEREKLYAQIKKEEKGEVKKKPTEQGGIIFRF